MLKQWITLVALATILLGTLVPQAVLAEDPIKPRAAEPAARPPVSREAPGPQWGGSWQYGSPPPFELARFDGGYYPPDGQVYFLGGRLPDNETSGRIWSWDPLADTYTDMEVDLVTPISNYTMNLLEDGSGNWGFYVFCGRADTGDNSFAVQVYYPDTNTPVQLDPADDFPGAIVCSSGLNVVYDNKVYVAGGFDSTANSAETWVFDPTAAVGSKWTHLPSADLNLARAYIMGVVVDDLIYAIGGSWFDGAALVNEPIVEVLDPNDPTPTWDDTAVADLLVPCSESRAWGFDSDSPYLDSQGTPLAGKIVSGCGYWSAQVPDVYVYNTLLDYWEAFPFFNSARRSQAGEFIPDTREMRVWGGYGSFETTEHYDLKVACSVLLVDDDWDQYSSEPFNGTGTYYYTSTLESLGHVYNRWDVWTQGDPSLADIQNYDVVIWFTGYAWDGTVTATNEADLAAYLDAGGKLFLTSADYLYDMGLTSFGTDYLGIATYDEDVEEVDVVGNAGNPIGDGLGPFTLVAPTSWPIGDPSMYTDYASGLQASPFRFNASGEDNSSNYENGAFQTIFFAWPFEGLGTLSQREVVLGSIMDWFGCAAPLPPGVALIPPFQAGSGPDDGEVAYDLTLINNTDDTDTFTITYDGDWPVTGPAEIGPIAKGASADFVVTVHIPSDANCGDVGWSLIGAIAQSDPDIWAEAEIETTVVPVGTGDVEGVVYDANTGLGIENGYVSIFVGSYFFETWADADGVYSFVDRPTCHYDGVVHAMGYFSEAFDVLVEADMTSTADITLTAAWPDLSETAVSVFLLPDEIYTHTLVASNEGTADLHWHISTVPGDGAYPLSRPALPAGVDAQVYTQLSASPDGQATFIVYMAEQADLTAAFGIPDWAARGRYVLDALRRTAERTQGGLLGQLRGAGVDYESRYIVNAVVVTGDAALLNAIAARLDVAYIGPNTAIPAPEPVERGPELDGAVNGPVWNVVKVRAPEVWEDFGATGEGVVVSNIDTGVQYDHPALVNQYRGTLSGGGYDHNYQWWDPYGYGPDEPYDWHNHGSHTVGTMCGSDDWDDPSGAPNGIGLAPRARWMACQGFDMNTGYGYDVELLECAEFVLAPWDLSGANADPALRPHVVNNSWGGGQAQQWYNQAVYAWRAAGILASFSNGNAGPSCGTAGEPGDMPNVIGVGATSSADLIAGFSSRGPSAIFGLMKPDVSAPGVNVISAYGNGGYGGMSGTSMAAPHVAGLAALIWSAQPDLIGDVQLTYWVITSTAMGIADGQCGDPGPPNNVYGWGRIDAYDAVDLAVNANWEIPWLTVDPLYGVLPPDDTQEITLVFDAADLLPNECYSGNLKFEFNDPYIIELLVPVELCVIGECEPIVEADFEWVPITPTVGEAVTFYGMADGSEPLTFAWDLGDGTTAAGPEISHPYAAAGTYTVVMTATNACSEEVVSYEITVLEACLPPYEVDFTWTPLEPAVGQAVTFNAAVEGTAPFTYTWDLGDGSDPVVVTDPTVVHTFAATGTYTVTLTVANACGELAADHALTVVATPPTWTVYLPLILK